MTNAIAALFGVVWLSLVALAALVIHNRNPRKRKSIDELEAVDAALRNRINDLENKYESLSKREANRASRAKQDAQPALPLAGMVGRGRLNGLTERTS